MKKIEETTSTKPSETTKPTEKHVNKVTSTCEIFDPWETHLERTLPNSAV